MKYYTSRKSNRLKHYNYSNNGAYFITICIKNKECLFGDIVVDDTVINPQLSNINDLIYQKSTNAKMMLSNYGKIAEKYIKTGSASYNGLSVDNYVIMPNHIHLIISNNLSEMFCSRTPQHDLIPAFVSAFKSLVSKEIGFSIFQRDYHDHIIRNEKEYQKIWDYIETNESNWVKDRFYMF